MRCGSGEGCMESTWSGRVREHAQKPRGVAVERTRSIAAWRCRFGVAACC